jgi:hypothetical protein
MTRWRAAATERAQALMGTPGAYRLATPAARSGQPPATAL